MYLSTFVNFGKLPCRIPSIMAKEQTQLSEELAWQQALRHDDIKFGVKAFLDTYPDGRYAPQAKLYLGSGRRRRSPRKVRRARRIKRLSLVASFVALPLLVLLLKPKISNKTVSYEGAIMEAAIPDLPKIVSQFEEKQLILYIEGGVPPYHLNILKNTQKKYTDEFSQEGEYKLSIQEFHKYSGTYKLQVIDAQENTVEEVISIDPLSVKLADRIWTAYNLDIVVDNSWCYENNNQNCQKYGRLYTWEGARQACKSLGTGWRLPSRQEWENLRNEIGGNLDRNREAFKKLVTGGGSGFEAPLGGFLLDGEFSKRGKSTRFWTNTDYMDRIAFTFRFEEEEMSRAQYTKTAVGYSCRCVKD